MKDLVEAGVDIIRQWLGIETPKELVPYIIILLAIGPVATWLYLSLRRWRGDFRAISGELHATAQLIGSDTRKELSGLLRKFEGLHEDLKGTVVSRLEALQSLFKSSEDVTGNREEELEGEPAPESRQPRQTRLAMAEQVRNSIIAKWLDGRFLNQISQNCFYYEGTSEAGLLIKLIFQTPYRDSIGTDGRLPFTLEVWVDGYKKLNFEWDSEGKYALRSFKGGDWIEDIAEWHFPLGASSKAAA